MTIPGALLAFIAAAAILTITPGLDTALVLRSAAAAGPRRAAYAAAGIALGCLIWGSAASVGLGALLAASRLAYTIIRWAGAAYLLYVGMSLIVRARASFDAALDGPAHGSPLTFLRQGLLTNILNPKVGVFYITFLPQFVPAGTNVALFSFCLAVVHVLLGLIWFAMLILASVPMRRVIRRPRFVRTMDRLAGAVFIGFGAKLVSSS